MPIEIVTDKSFDLRHNAEQPLPPDHVALASHGAPAHRWCVAGEDQWRRSRDERERVGVPAKDEIERAAALDIRCHPATVDGSTHTAGVARRETDDFEAARDSVEAVRIDIVRRAAR